MDARDFKATPTEYDLLVITQKVQARIVNSCHDRKLYLNDYEGLPLEVKHLGGKGIMDKLLLHIPFKEVVETLTTISQSLPDGEECHSWLVTFNEEGRWDWDISYGKLYEKDKEWDDRPTISHNQSKEELSEIALVLIKGYEGSFERT